MENLRNELYLQEYEESARVKEQAEIEKRENFRQQLMAAKEY